MPDMNHAGGLRFHGMAPLVSHLHGQDVIEAEAIHPECFDFSVVREHGGYRAGSGTNSRAGGWVARGGKRKGVRVEDRHFHGVMRTRTPRPR